MILALNYSIGILIWASSWIIIQFHSNLRIKFSFVKNQISNLEEFDCKSLVSLYKSLIEIEDKRYYSHMGVDVYSIIRAFIQNLLKGRFEGASTIVQQLVRGITNERELTLRRKIKEIIIASLIDRKFSKNQILYAYSCFYEFQKCIGVFDFCKIEKIDIQKLSTSESAQIAARFKYPVISKKNYIRYLKRVRVIEIKTEKISFPNL